MSDNRFLMEAIDCIDDSFLEKYFTMKKEQSIAKAKRKRVVKWSLSLAACLSIFLVTIIIIELIQMHNTSNIQYGYTQEYRLYYKGDKSIGKNGVIEFVDFDDNSITIQFEKTTSDYVYATLCGYSVDKSSNTRKVYLGMTFYEAQVTGVKVVNDGIKLFVDDKLASSFPKEAGQYTIRIEYSKLKESCEQMDVGIYISGFDYFVINPFTIEGIDPSKLIPNTGNASS